VDALTYYADVDGDGQGDSDVHVTTCTQPASTVTDSSDCDDGDEYTYLGAPELCDNVDNNCDGFVDDGLTLTAYYADVDGDGFGDAADVVWSCPIIYDRVENDLDCDDADAAINPDAVEVCDPSDVDEDCSGAADDADPGATGQTAWYLDVDNDGHGNENDTARFACEPLTGEVDNNDDCDDTIALVYPGIGEACSDRVDNGCDGLIDKADADAVCDMTISCHDSGSWLDWTVTGALSQHMEPQLSDVDELCFYAIDVDPAVPYRCEFYLGDGSNFQLTVVYSSLAITGKSSGGAEAELDLWTADSTAGCPVTIDSSGTSFYIAYP